METTTFESLYNRTVAIEEKIGLIMELLTKEEKKKREQREEKDELTSIPPIPNYQAAKLLMMSTRQLQRVRRKYCFTWIERGREVFYHLVPIIKAIAKYQLRWSEPTLEEIKKSHKKLPSV